MSQTAPPPPPQPPTPPPAPPAGPPPGVASSAPFSVGDSVGYGWNAYWNNLGPMLLIVVVMFAIEIAFSVFSSVIGSSAGSTLVSLVGFLISVLLALGLVRVSLALTRGEEPKVSMLFETTHYGTYLVASILFGIGAFISVFAFIVGLVVFATFFSFYGFVVVDQDERNPVDALKRSAKLVAGHFWSVLGLAIVLVLINIVGLMLLGIGMLVTYGITVIAWAYAYRALSGQSVAPAK